MGWASGGQGACRFVPGRYCCRLFLFVDVSRRLLMDEQKGMGGGGGGFSIHAARQRRSRAIGRVLFTLLSSEEQQAHAAVAVTTSRAVEYGDRPHPQGPLSRALGAIERGDVCATSGKGIAGEDCMGTRQRAATRLARRATDGALVSRPAADVRLRRVP